MSGFFGRGRKDDEDDERPVPPRRPERPDRNDRDRDRGDWSSFRDQGNADRQPSRAIDAGGDWGFVRDRAGDRGRPDSQNKKGKDKGESGGGRGGFLRRGKGDDDKKASPGDRPAVPTGRYSPGSPSSSPERDQGKKGDDKEKKGGFGFLGRGSKDKDRGGAKDARSSSPRKSPFLRGGADDEDEQGRPGGFPQRDSARRLGESPFGSRDRAQPIGADDEDRFGVPRTSSYRDRLSPSGTAPPADRDRFGSPARDADGDRFGAPRQDAFRDRDRFGSPAANADRDRLSGARPDTFRDRVSPSGTAAPADRDRFSSPARDAGGDRFGAPRQDTFRDRDRLSPTGPDTSRDRGTFGTPSRPKSSPRDRGTFGATTSPPEPGSRDRSPYGGTPAGRDWPRRDQPDLPPRSASQTRTLGSRPGTAAPPQKGQKQPPKEEKRSSKLGGLLRSSKSKGADKDKDKDKGKPDFSAGRTGRPLDTTRAPGTSPLGPTSDVRRKSQSAGLARTTGPVSAPTRGSRPAARPASRAASASEARPLARPLPGGKQKSAFTLRQGLDFERKIDLIGVALVGFALVAFFAVLPSMSFGVLPAPQGGLTGALNRLLSQMFGWGKIVWPVVAFAVGVWLMVQSFGDKVIEIPYFRIVGVISLYLCALTWLQMLQSINYPAPTVEAFRPISYHLAVTEGKGGGWVGHEIYLLLLSQLLDWGTLSVLIAWLLMSLMLTFDVSVVELWGYTIGIFAVFRVNDEERARRRAAQEALTKDIVTAMRPGEAAAQKTPPEKAPATDKTPSLVRTRVVGRAAPGSEAAETVETAGVAAASAPDVSQSPLRPGPVINRRAGAGNGDSGEEAASAGDKTGAVSAPAALEGAAAKSSELADAAALSPSPRRLPHMRRPAAEGGEKTEPETPGEPARVGGASPAAPASDTTDSGSKRSFGFLGRRGSKAADQESAEVPTNKAAAGVEGPEEVATSPERARGTRLSPFARPSARESGAENVPGIPVPPRSDRPVVRDTIEHRAASDSPPSRPDQPAVRDTIEHRATSGSPPSRSDQPASRDTIEHQAAPGSPLPRSDRPIRDTIEHRAASDSSPRPDQSPVRDTIEHPRMTSGPLRRPPLPDADRSSGEAGSGESRETDASKQVDATGRSGRLGRFLPSLRRSSESAKEERTVEPAKAATDIPDAGQASEESSVGPDSRRLGRFLPGLRRSGQSKDEPAAEAPAIPRDVNAASRVPGGDRQPDAGSPAQGAPARGLNTPARTRTLAFDEAARPDQPDTPSGPFTRRPASPLAGAAESPEKDQEEPGQAQDKEKEDSTPDRGERPRLGALGLAGAAALLDRRRDEPPARNAAPGSRADEPPRRQMVDRELPAQPSPTREPPRPPVQSPFSRPPVARPFDTAADAEEEAAEAGTAKAEPQDQPTAEKPARPALLDFGGRRDIPARPGMTPRPGQPGEPGQPASPPARSPLEGPARLVSVPSPLAPEPAAGEKSGGPEAPAAARPAEPLRAMPARPQAAQEKEQTGGSKPGETQTAPAEQSTRRASTMPPAMLEEDDLDESDEDFDEDDLYEEESEVESSQPQRPSVTGRTLPFERPAAAQRTPLIVHHPAAASQETRPAPPTIQRSPGRSPEPATAAASGENAPTRIGGFSRSNVTYEVPDFRKLLKRGDEKRIKDEVLLEKARVIEDTLMSFSAPGKVVEVNPGPVITQFGVEPDYVMGRSGRKMRVKVGAIARLDADLALALAAKSIRIEAPVPGKGFVGIEVPNDEVALVGLYDIMESPEFTRIDSKLRIALGLAVDGTPVAADLAAMPHLLIAGTTGSGKSVCVNSIISCLLLQNTPEDVQFIMVDPKRVELTGYNGIPHLVAPVVVDLERIVGVLQWVQREMEERYRKFAAIAARNILDYNHKIGPDETRMPYYIVVVDELADLMMLAPDETERLLTRLAQMSRATGIHLIISTQRPSVDIITGLIKANFPARIAFAVASSVDSRVILDQPGAEKLLGRGDMLYQSPDAAAPLRMQGVFVSDEEITRITRYWKGLLLQEADEKGDREALASPSRDLAFKPLDTTAPRPKSRPAQRPLWDNGDADEDDESGLGEDELYGQAVELIQRLNKASISLLQRRLRIGYTRAARLIDRMEAEGIVGPAESGSKPREVLKGVPRQTGGDD